MTTPDCVVVVDSGAIVQVIGPIPQLQLVETTLERGRLVLKDLTVPRASCLHSSLALNA